MAFTPDPNLFANSLGAGMRVGSGFADLFRQRKQEGELRRIAQMAASGNPDYNQIGAGLIGAGQVGAGVNALGVPYQREQDSMDMEMRRRVLENQISNQNRPNLPVGYNWNDPNNPSAGVSLLPGFDPRLGDTPETWLAPARVIGEDGQPKLVQFSNRGNVKPADGFAPAGNLQKTDTGTEEIYTNPITGEIVSRVPKQNREAAYQTESGKVEAKADAERQETAPQEYAAAEDAIAFIDKVRNHPGIDVGTGATSTVANRVPGTAAYDFQNLVSQVSSTAFLSAVSQMRGLGALSDTEGKAARQAVTRLDTATSKEAFLDALADYEKIVTRGRDRAKEIIAKRGQRYRQESALPVEQRSTLADAGTPGVVQPVPQNVDNDPLGLR